MDTKKLKYKIINWFGYFRFLIKVNFFKTLVLFLLSFTIFGLYLQDFFKTNFIIFLVLLGIDLYIIRKILYKKIRFTKVLVVLIVICISFFVAQGYSEKTFDKFGLTNFIHSFNEEGEFSDNLILASTKDMLKASYDVGKDLSESTVDSATHSKEGSMKTFEYINQLRKEHNVSEIIWDDKIYELAKYKVDDMSERNYFDHPDPDGKCPGSYAGNFGLTYPASSFADNLFGYSSPTWFDQKEAVDSWMTSRGHKYNLLFNGHLKGAFACNMQYCIFIGQGGSGWVCDTGDAGIEFWNSVGTQPGEK